MDNSFVWIIDEDTQRSLVRRGVAAHYVIPSGMMNGHETDIVRSRLWLITRGTNDVVTAFLWPKKVERFTEGMYEGDYLLTVDLHRSFKVVNRDGNWYAYTTPYYSEYHHGITEISTEVEYQLLDLIVKKIQTKIQSPSKNIKGLLLDKIPAKSNKFLAMMAVNEILKNYSLDEVWGSKLGIVLSPFANFGYALINEHFGQKSADESLEYLETYDPLTRMNNSGKPIATEKEEKTSITHEVAIDFVQIEPETIYAREFIVSRQNDTDIEAALAKTEAAEKLHQEMLRDISSYLISKGVIPFESSSIDLMYEFSKKAFIIEIKSTNSDNLMAQCAKGAFQLAFYGDAVKDYMNVSSLRLIIHKTDNKFQEELCLRVLSMLSTECLIYDPSKEWPDRLPGLLSI